MARKAQKLSPQDRKKKAERNARRKRDVEAVRWAREHVVKQPYILKTDRRTKQQRAGERLAEALKGMNALQDAEAHKGSTTPRNQEN